MAAPRRDSARKCALGLVLVCLARPGGTLDQPAAETLGYVPALAEREWFDGAPVDGRICSTANSATQVAEQRLALQLADRWRAGEQILPHGAAALGPPTHVSQMSRCSAAGCRVEPIEPLSAVARHPFADIGCAQADASGGAQPSGASGAAVRALNRTGLLDIRYLLLHSACPRGRGGAQAARAEDAQLEPAPGLSPIGRPRSLFFDVGCTAWSTSSMSGRRKRVRSQPLTGYAVGPSLPLFSELYARQCVAFDHLWGWEAFQYSPEAWWAPVPVAVRPRLTFINRPVDANSQDPELNPLLKIGQVARPEDFVALKLDIDMFEIEHALVDELLTNRRGTNASRLVDELFFEYHFGLRERSRFSDKTPLMPFWGGRAALRRKQRGGSVAHALELMQSLRKLGIRAHFWI